MRALRWLVLAAILFVVAALLMRSGEEVAAPERRAAKVELPRHASPEDVARRKMRSTLLERVKPESPDEAPVEVRHDPFLLAMPPAGPRENAVVIEANAIRHSALGERLIACLTQKEGASGLDEMEKELGLNVLEDVDRVGVTDKVFMVSGALQKLRLRGQPISELASEAHGDAGKIYASEGELFATWKDEVLLVGHDRADLEAAIDRIEGRGPRAEPAIAEDEAYGEIYGHLSPELLLGLVPSEHRERLRDKLDAAAKRVDLHVNVEDDVGMVLSVNGDDSPELTDLAKSLGSAFAVGRTMAKAQGEDELAEILDRARVARSYRSRAGAAFDAELALPRALLEKHLAEVCPGPERAPPP